MLTVNQIENGKYYENEETENYQHTHYRCHWLGNGKIWAEAVCINQYGSCFGIGYGYNLEKQTNPKWHMDWTDIEV